MIVRCFRVVLPGLHRGLFRLVRAPISSTYPPPTSKNIMTLADIDTWEILTSSFGEQLIRQMVGQLPLEDDTTEVPQNYRHRLLNAFCEQQAFWRKRSWPRFPREATWFWTDTLLQQASDWQTALYKASLIPDDAPIFDLCCGAGVDAVALSHSHPVTAIDIDPLACYLTQANYDWNKLDFNADGTMRPQRSFAVECGDVLEQLDELHAWVHIDPDRRPDEKRTTSTEWMQPSLESLIPLLQQCPGGMIKLAPATEVPLPWSERCCRLWVGDRRQCRQQLLIWGLPQFPAGQLGAVSLDAACTIIPFLSQSEPFADSTATPDQFVFDFHPSLRASGLSAAFALSLGIASLGDVSGYLTGPEPIDHSLVDAYEVLEAISWDEKKVRKMLRDRNIGTLVVKKRGCKGLDPNKLQLSLPDKRGELSGILILAEINKKQMALLVKPCTTGLA